MTERGIRVASLSVQFVWEKGAIVGLGVSDVRYFREYEPSSSLTPGSDTGPLLERLDAELKPVALNIAKDRLKARDLKGFSRAYGTEYITLFDDECVPRIDPDAQVCDGDETPLMRRMDRGAENSDVVGVDAPLCTDLREPELDKRDPIELIARGIDVNAKDHQGWTALMAAATTGYTAGLKVLLENGARVNDRDAFGRSALSVAAGRGDLEPVRLLLRFGAEVNVQDDDGRTPLMEAAGGVEDTSGLIKLLRAAGAALNTRKQDGETALMIAAWNGSVDAVRALLELGADPNAKTPSGDTALSLAEMNGHADVVNVLKRSITH